MRWFDKWFSKKVKEAWEDHNNMPELRYEGKTSQYPAVARTNSPEINSRGVRFTLHKASGGYIVEYATYDPKTDTHDNRLHIVTEEKELGEELSKIITFESLRS